MDLLTNTILYKWVQVSVRAILCRLHTCSLFLSQNNLLKLGQEGLGRILREKGDCKQSTFYGAYFTINVILSLTPGNLGFV